MNRAEIHESQHDREQNCRLATAMNRSMSLKTSYFMSTVQNIIIEKLRL